MPVMRPLLILMLTGLAYGRHQFPARTILLANATNHTTPPTIAPTPYATAMSPFTSQTFFTLILGGLVPNKLLARQIGMYWRSDIASTLGVAPDQVVITDLHWTADRPVHIYFSLFGADPYQTNELLSQIGSNSFNPVPENPVKKVWVRAGPGRQARHDTMLTALLISIPCIALVVLVGYLAYQNKKQKYQPRRMKLVPGGVSSVPSNRRTVYNAHNFDPLAVPEYLVQSEDGEKEPLTQC